MAKRNTDFPMTASEIEDLREVWRSSGNNAKSAAEALGINRETFTRALAGLPILGSMASYIRLSLPRTLERLRRGQAVDRTG